MEQMGKTTEQHRAPKKKGTTTKEKKLMMRHQAWFARTTRACTEKEVESMFAIGTRNRTIEVPLRLHLSCQSATRTAINSTVDKRHALEMYVLHIQKLHKTQSADHQQKQVKPSKHRPQDFTHTSRATHLHRTNHGEKDINLKDARTRAMLATT